MRHLKARPFSQHAVRQNDDPNQLKKNLCYSLPILVTSQYEQHILEWDVMIEKEANNAYYHTSEEFFLNTISVDN